MTRPRVLGLYTDRIRLDRQPTGSDASPIASAPPKKITYGGVGYYRLHAPLTAQGYPVSGKPGRELPPSISDYLELFRRYDILHMTRIENPTEMLIALSARDIEQGRLIIDCDDDLLHVDRLSPAWEKYRPGSPVVRLVHQLFEQCDALTVSRPSLARIYQDRNPNIAIIPNGCEPARWDVTPSPRSDDGEWIRIGWAGSLVHESDLQVVQDVLLDAIKRHPRVKLCFMGYTPHFIRKQGLVAADRWEEVEPSPTFDSYPQYLAKAHFDIALAPLVQSAFSQSKSAIKFFEYSLCGFPTIASRGDDLPYQEVIESGETGFLASRFRDWQRALDRLIESADERRRIGEAARAQVRAQHDVRRLEPLYQEVYQRVLAQPAKRLPRGFALA